MAQQQTLDGATRAILTEPFSSIPILAAAGAVCRAVAIEPKPFFAAIGAEARANVANALAFFATALVAYVALEIVFEQALIHGAGYEAQTLTSYYATPFAEQNLPFAEVFGFAAAVGHIWAAALFAVVYWTISMWTFAHAFFHTAKIASLRSMFVAGLYAFGAASLLLASLSIPAAYLDAQNTGPFEDRSAPMTDLANFVTAIGLQAKYDFVLLYLYLRSVSFTTDLRLHWGLVFCALLFYAVAIFTRGI